MKEQAFNLFYFVHNGLVEELGAIVHELEGSDEEKLDVLRAAVSTDHKHCQHFPLHHREDKARRMSLESFNAFSRVGRELELFEPFFVFADAGQNPLYCLTGIEDGKPKEDTLLLRQPGFLFRRHLEPEQDKAAPMPDYLEEYLTPDGFDLPALFNDDYFSAIRLCFNHRYYVSCMKLIASFIDTVAFLEFGDTQGNFVMWLEAYAELGPLNVTANQLWEFRNSLLHMSNLDSRKVLTGREKRISFCVAASGYVSPPDNEIQYFNLLDLITAIAEGLSKWIHSLSIDRDRFPVFVERYDRVVSDSRCATRHKN